MHWPKANFVLLNLALYFLKIKQPRSIKNLILNFVLSRTTGTSSSFEKWILISRAKHKGQAPLLLIIIRLSCTYVHLLRCIVKSLIKVDISFTFFQDCQFLAILLSFSRLLLDNILAIVAFLSLREHSSDNLGLRTLLYHIVFIVFIVVQIYLVFLFG